MGVDSCSSTVILTNMASRIAPTYSTKPYQVLVVNIVQVLISIRVLIVTSSLFLLSLRIYIDCRDAYEQGQTQSGVYTIQPDSNPTFRAYCEMDTDGGGWTASVSVKTGRLSILLPLLDGL